MFYFNIILFFYISVKMEKKIIFCLVPSIIQTMEWNIIPSDHKLFKQWNGIYVPLRSISLYFVPLHYVLFYQSKQSLSLSVTLTIKKM